MLGASDESRCAFLARVRVPHFCTNARLTGSLGMVLNDGPERSCCWSSTLRSQDAKLTLTEAIAEWIVRAIDMALIVAWIEPIGLRGAPEVVLERGEIVLSEKPRHLAPRSTSESHISQQLSGRRPHCRSEGTETNRNGAGRPSLITRFRAANSHIPDGAPSVGRNSGARDGENCVVALGDRVHIM
jgi:hypothetical protein